MEFANLQSLLWLLLLLVLGAGLWFSLVDRPSALKFGSFALRSLGIILLVLAISRPFWKDRGEEAHVVFLVDISESVDLDAAEAAVGEIGAAIKALEPGDSWSLFAVGDGVRNFETPEALTELLGSWKKGVADDRFRAGSRLSDAMLSARLAFPSGKSRRLVLYSDGQETVDRESLTDALETLDRERVDVRFRPVEGLREPEAAVVAMEPSSPFAYEGEMVRMNVTVAANEPMKAKLRLLHRGVAVREVPVELEARPDNRFPVDVAMNTPGPSVWTAELLPAADHFPINNQLATTVQVRGQPRVLFLHEDPRELRPLSRALKEQDIEVEARGRSGLPEAMEELLAFDAIVLADVPATDLSVRQMEQLQRYVEDFGGGLVMMGSDNSFGLGGYYKTPVEEVLPLTSRFEKEKEKPSLAMVLVIDKSGSMQGLPIQLARQAAKATVELLGGRDQIAVIGFDSQAQIVCEMRSAADRLAVQGSIDSLEAGGGTDVYPAMVAGREMLETAPAQVKHMIILSDGQTQPADHLGLTQAMADGGITVSTVALGQGAARELMASIAEIGRGRYYETMDPASVPQIFTKETMQASKSAIKEDLFGVVASGDHPVLAGYQDADLPFALGYVMTEPKPTAQVLLVAETGDPLLAYSRFGLGVGLAYTSDLTEQWGGEWLAWGDCGKFWAQVFRGVVRKSDAEGLIANTAPDKDRWRIDIAREDPNRMPVAGVNWEATLLDENGMTIPVEVEEVGLGRYRADVPVADRGNVSLRLHDRDSDKLKVLHRTADYPVEYRLAKDLPPSLENLARFEPAAVRAGLEPESRHRAVFHWFVFAAFACLLGGIVLRRV
ncbi:MAG: VWA domain-containing protein [Verrucomicrobiae bacterium]|nr:VWA domain-containing protein [Verrucomicrobiae bacterium]